MRLLGVLGAGTLIFASACGGGGDGDGGPGPTPQQTLGEIRAAVTTLNLTAGGTSTIQMTALDTQGATISNPGPYQFTSSATNIVEVSQQGAVVGIAAGTGSINVTLSRGGITKTATVNVVVTGNLGLSATVAAGAANTFEPQVVAIARTGSVTWSFGTVQHNVMFSGTTGAPANIPNSAPNTTVSRTFSTAGNFAYDCNLHAGMVGTVIVR